MTYVYIENQLLSPYKSLIISYKIAYSSRNYIFKKEALLKISQYLYCSLLIQLL